MASAETTWARAWRAIRPFLIGYLLVLLAMTFLERSLVYPIPPVDRGDWQPNGLEFEEVWFHAADGTRLNGWFVPHDEAKFGLVYCHGNGEHVGDNAWLAAELRDRLGASLLLFDYRGYGHSSGKPDEAGLVADGLAAQRLMAEKMDVAPDELVVMGRSIGASVAVAIAAEQGARALVLENAFSRLTDVAAWHYPWLPIRWLMRNRFDSIERIARYDGPLFQSHGTADQIAPIAFARELFATAPSPVKQFVEIPDRGHNDPPPDDYYRQLADFLNQLDQEAHKLPDAAP